MGYPGSSLLELTPGRPLFSIEGKNAAQQPLESTQNTRQSITPPRNPENAIFRALNFPDAAASGKYVHTCDHRPMKNIGLSPRRVHCSRSRWMMNMHWMTSTNPS
jgi:hypothetical protein